MIISELQLRALVRQVLVEIGPGVGMDPIGITKPQGMERSEYKQLEAADPDVLKTVIQIFDPSGTTSIPDIGPAYNNYKKDPSLMNKVFLILAVTAAIPVAGKLSKLGSGTLKTLSRGLAEAKKVCLVIL